MSNPWKEVERLGQSLWYDNLSRAFISGGEIAGMIEELGLRGITSNPSIFEKSITGSDEYDADIEQAIHDGLTTSEIYERLTTDDVRSAADVMRPVFDRTKGIDGYVSIEVEPRLAGNTNETIEAARRLWKTVNRPNIMIKIPGTPEGIPGVQSNASPKALISISRCSSGSRIIHKWHTRLFGCAPRTQTARGGYFARIASVASFSLSRVDTNVA